MNCPKALLFDAAAASSSAAGAGGGAGARDYGMRQDMLSRAVNDLEARRLVVCDEVGSDLCLSDDKFKQITGGGDTMTARRLHQDARPVDTSLSMQDFNFGESSRANEIFHDFKPF